MTETRIPPVSPQSLPERVEAAEAAVLALASIELENDNHDDRGRFTSSGDGGGSAAKPEASSAKAPAKLGPGRVTTLMGKAGIETWKAPRPTYTHNGQLVQSVATPPAGKVEVKSNGFGVRVSAGLGHYVTDQARAKAQETSQKAEAAVKAAGYETSRMPGQYGSYHFDVSMPKAMP